MGPQHWAIEGLWVCVFQEQGGCRTCDPGDAWSVDRFQACPVWMGTAQAGGRRTGVHKVCGQEIRWLFFISESELVTICRLVSSLKPYYCFLLQVNDWIDILFLCVIVSAARCCTTTGLWHTGQVCNYWRLQNTVVHGCTICGLFIVCWICSNVGIIGWDT